MWWIHCSDSLTSSCDCGEIKEYMLWCPRRKVAKPTLICRTESQFMQKYTLTCSDPYTSAYGWTFGTSSDSCLPFLLTIILPWLYVGPEKRRIPVHWLGAAVSFVKRSTNSLPIMLCDQGSTLMIQYYFWQPF